MKILNQSIITLLILAYANYSSAATLEVKEVVAASENSQLIEALSNPVIAGANHQLSKEDVTKLINSTADLNQQTISGTTALHLSAMNGHFNAVELLLSDKRCDVNIEDNDGFTALAFAVENQNLEMVKLLLKDKRVKLETRSFKGKKQFLKNFEEIKKLSVKDNAEAIRRFYKIKDIGGLTPLMQAIKHKNREIVLELLNANANPASVIIKTEAQNLQSLISDPINTSFTVDYLSFDCKELKEEFDKYQNGAQMAAAYILADRLNMAKLYIKNCKVNTNILALGTMDKLRILTLTNLLDVYEIINLMFNSGLNATLEQATKKNGESFFSTFLGCNSIFKLILQKGGNPNQCWTTSDGQKSLLDYAIEGENTETIQLLIDAGAQPIQSQWFLKSTDRV